MDAKINQIIIDIIKPFNPKEIAVFGSYARGQMTSQSDIDILVDFDENTTLFDVGGMYMDLKESLKRKIDLVSKSGLNKLFEPYIMQDLKIIYEKK